MFYMDSVCSDIQLSNFPCCRLIVVLYLPHTSLVTCDKFCVALPPPPILITVQNEPINESISSSNLPERRNEQSSTLVPLENQFRNKSQKYGWVIYTNRFKLLQLYVKVLFMSSSIDKVKVKDNQHKVPFNGTFSFWQLTWNYCQATDIMWKLCNVNFHSRRSFD